VPEREATVKLSAGWRKCIQSKPAAEQGCNPGLRSTSLGQLSLGYVAIHLPRLVCEKAFIFSGLSEFAGWGA